MIINDIKDYKYDTYKKKVRAILIDENNDIYVTKFHDFNNTRVFPGGSVEIDENITDAIIREVLEEVGVEISNPTYLGYILYFHENFPNLKNNPIDYGTRVNEVHYFYSYINTKDIGASQYTEFEKSHSMKIEKYKLDNLINLLIKETNDEFSKSVNEETLSAFNFYKSKLYFNKTLD